MKALNSLVIILKADDCKLSATKLTSILSALLRSPQTMFPMSLGIAVRLSHDIMTPQAERQYAKFWLRNQSLQFTAFKSVTSFGWCGKLVIFPNCLSKHTVAILELRQTTFPSENFG